MVAAFSGYNGTDPVRSPVSIPAYDYTEVFERIQFVPGRLILIVASYGKERASKTETLEVERLGAKQHVRARRKFA
jgi:hypothetical protein